MNRTSIWSRPTEISALVVAFVRPTSDLTPVTFLGSPRPERLCSEEKTKWWRRGESNPRPKKRYDTEPTCLAQFSWFRPPRFRMSKKRSRLVRWFSPEPYGPKGSGQLNCLTLLTGPMSKARGSVRLIIKLQVPDCYWHF